jgi:hypothetical protein
VVTGGSDFAPMSERYAEDCISDSAINKEPPASTGGFACDA